MKNHLLITSLFCGSILFLLTQCNQFDHKQEVGILRETDSRWSLAAESKNDSAYMAYFLDDATVLPPNEPMISGKEAIRKSTAAMFAQPGFSIKWKNEKTELAVTGDFGYTMGKYELAMRDMSDTTGKLITDKGKYLTVWKKLPNADWQVAADMYSSDLPVAK